MSYGLGTAGARTNKTEAAGGAGLTAANNGLTTAGAVVQLGQNIGAVGNPSQFLNDREIEMAGFFFQMLDAGNLQLFIDPNGLYQLGDINGGNNNLFLTIDDVNQRARISNGGDDYFLINLVNKSFQLGDVDGALNNTRLEISDTGKLQRFWASDEFSFIDPNTANKFLELAPVLNLYQLGDISNKHNQTFLNIDDAAPRVRITSGAVNYLDLNVANGAYFLGDSSGPSQLSVDQTQGKIDGIINGQSVIYADKTLGIYDYGDVNGTGSGMFLSVRDDLGYIDIGDVYGVVNATVFKIDDGNRNFQALNSGNCYLLLDIANNLYKVGDIGSLGYLKLDNAGGNAVITIGDADTAGNGTKIEVDHNNGISLLCTTNGIFLGGNGYLCLTNALTDGAAAQTATLTNSPLAGNPTKWIKILDNGVTRHIPAW